MTAPDEVCSNCAQPMATGTAFCQTCGAQRPSTSEMAGTPTAGNVAAVPIAQPSASGTGVGLKLLAALHLVGALILGAPMIGGTATHLKSAAEVSSYGGDAYTGIQNAAAYTENSVVKASNSQADSLQNIERLLGALLIGSGLLNVAVAFRRPGPGTPSYAKPNL